MNPTCLLRPKGSRIFLLALVGLALATAYAEPNDLLGQFCDYNADKASLTCSSFDSFDQLNFKQIEDIGLVRVTLAPRSNLKLPIDSKLNLDGLVLKSTDDQIAVLKFQNIQGFDPYYNPFLDLKFQTSLEIFDLEFESGVWEFKASGQDSFMSEDDCEKLVQRKRQSEAQRRKNLRQNSLLFSDLSINKFTLKTVTLNSNDSPLCPLLFKGTSITEWLFDSPRGKLRYVNLDIDAQLIENTNVAVSRLNVVGGLSGFIYNLNSNSLLNEILFNKITSLSFRKTYINSIEAESLGKFKMLKYLSLVDLDLRNVLIRDASWLSVLNAGTDFDWSSGDESQLTNGDYFKLVLGYDPSTYTAFNLDDTNLCLFKHLPHNQLIIPLFDSYAKNISSVFLPCTCTVFWLYKHYPSYAHRLTPFEQTNMIPPKCLSIPPDLFTEQIEDCGLDKDAVCSLDTPSSVSSSPTTSPAKRGDCLPFDLVDPQWGKFCTCSFSGDLNILECTNSSIEQVPSDFRTRNNVSWSYVTFAGSSIAELDTNSFRYLRLQENATILFQNIQMLQNDVFVGDLFYENKFSFVLRNSSLFFLGYKQPFTDTSFSELVFEDCLFDATIPVSAFLGAKIDLFLIRQPKDGSTVFFRPAPLFREIVIKKFKVQDAYDAFKKFGVFALDSIILNQGMLQYTEELEVTNTNVDFIDSTALGVLENLKIVRFENVQLKNIINYYFNLLSMETPPNGEVYYDDPFTNWLAKEELERVYFGREHVNAENFEFENKYLCYFAGLKTNARVFIYDSIDYKDGIVCTCTVYWFYRQVDMSELLADPDAKYVPKCIKDLGTQANLNSKLNQCLESANLGDPLKNCKTIPPDWTSTSTTTTKTTTTSTITTASITTTATTTPTSTTSASTTRVTSTPTDNSDTTTTTTTISTTTPSTPSTQSSSTTTTEPTTTTTEPPVTSTSTTTTSTTDKTPGTTTTTKEPTVTQPTTIDDIYSEKLDKISRNVLILGLFFGISLTLIMTTGLVFIYMKLLRMKKVPANQVEPVRKESIEMF